MLPSPAPARSSGGNWRLKHGSKRQILPEVSLPVWIILRKSCRNCRKKGGRRDLKIAVTLAMSANCDTVAPKL